MKQVKLYQDIEFKLVGARDMDPRDVLPDAPTAIGDRTSEEDPSMGDIARVSDEAATVIYLEGYASVFVNADGSRLEDRDGESVSIALLNIENFKKNPIMVFDHNWSDAMGKVTHIEKDAKGLYVKAEMHKLTGRENVFEAVQKGITKTFSIGFIAKTYTYLEDEDIFEISSAELVELSIVNVPSNQDAIFTPTSQKSMTVSKRMLKEQNNMTCDEVNGLCSMSKQIKGKKMDLENKDTDTVAASTTETTAEATTTETTKVAADTTEVKVDVTKVEASKDDPKTEMSVENLADAISQATELADEKKAEKVKQEEDEKTAQDQAEKDAAAKRVEDVFSYIREQKAEIEATEAGDIDVDALGDLYELLSDTVELIDNKVTSAVSNASS